MRAVLRIAARPSSAKPSIEPRVIDGAGPRNDDGAVDGAERRRGERAALAGEAGHPVDPPGTQGRSPAQRVPSGPSRRSATASGPPGRPRARRRSMPASQSGLSGASAGCMPKVVLSGNSWTAGCRCSAAAACSSGQPAGTIAGQAVEAAAEADHDQDVTGVRGVGVGRAASSRARRRPFIIAPSAPAAAAAPRKPRRRQPRGPSSGSHSRCCSRTLGLRCRGHRSHRFTWVRAVEEQRRDVREAPAERLVVVGNARARRAAEETGDGAAVRRGQRRDGQLRPAMSMTSPSVTGGLAGSSAAAACG